MMGMPKDSTFGQAVQVTEASPDARTLIVCEHASCRIPASLGDLGLPSDVLCSHIAWDPGALGVAFELAKIMDAPLVHGQISRLVYDCNRPPEAHDSIPARSEVHDIPGNADLSDAERQARIDQVYVPFRDHLSGEITARRGHLDLMVTVHSFTPVYHGAPRPVELGILHGRDDRFAQAMLAAKPAEFEYDVRLNEPYAASDGVAHTLDIQGVNNGLLNVMLEIRNDLITTADDQTAWATVLAPWLHATLAGFAEGDME